MPAIKALEDGGARRESGDHRRRRYRCGNCSWPGADAAAGCDGFLRAAAPDRRVPIHQARPPHAHHPANGRAAGSAARPLGGGQEPEHAGDHALRRHAESHYRQGEITCAARQLVEADTVLIAAASSPTRLSLVEREEAGAGNLPWVIQPASHASGEELFGIADLTHPPQSAIELLRRTRDSKINSAAKSERPAWGPQSGA